MASHSVMTTPPLCNFTANMSDITPTVSVSSPPLDQFYQPQYMYAITATMCMTSYALQVTSHPQFRTSHHFMMSGPLYLTSLPLYLCHHTHPVDDITATIWMNSHSVYLWHHIHYIYYRISTKYDITTLCVHDATLSVCMEQTLHFRAQCPHSIKQNHSIYDVTSTSGTTKQLLYQTLHPLYLYHHTLCTDMSATFV